MKMIGNTPKKVKEITFIPDFIRGIDIRANRGQSIAWAIYRKIFKIH